MALSQKGKLAWLIGAVAIRCYSSVCHTSMRAVATMCDAIYLNSGRVSSQDARHPPAERQ